MDFGEERQHSKDNIEDCQYNTLYALMILPLLLSDNKSFFVLSMSDNGAQIYELMAQTVSEQRT